MTSEAKGPTAPQAQSIATHEKRSNERRRHVTSEAKGPMAQKARAFATQEKRSNMRRRRVTSEAKGPKAPQAHAVCIAKEAKRRATPSCDERSEGTDSASGTRRLQRKRSEAMSNAVM